MFPSFATKYFPHKGIGHAKALCDGVIRDSFAGGKFFDGDYILGLEFGPRMFLASAQSSLISRMTHVFGARYPLKVLKTVIMGITIKVCRIKSISGSYKSLKNGAMHMLVNLLAIDVRTKAKIAKLAAMLFELDRMPIAFVSPSSTSLACANIAKVRDLIIRTVDNVFPNFHYVSNPAIMDQLSWGHC